MTDRVLHQFLLDTPRLLPALEAHFRSSRAPQRRPPARGVWRSAVLDRTDHPEEVLELEFEIDRKSAPYVRWVQSALNTIQTAGLTVDGSSGRITRDAIAAFQREKRLSADGIVGPQTEAALIVAGAGDPPGAATGTPYSPTPFAPSRSPAGVSSYAAATPPTPFSLATPMSAGGASVFERAFSGDPMQQTPMRTYLLTWLSTMVYADRGLNHLLPEAIRSQPNTVNRLTTDDEYFEQLFAEFVSPYFGLEYERPAARSRPKYFRYVAKRADALAFPGAEDIPLALDPEAIVINAPFGVFVVFRGTDDIASGWGMEEWVSTNFWFYLTDTKQPTIRGQVHAGMWRSLEAILDVLTEHVRDMSEDGRKPVWITGHSLGAAQATLFSAYLISKLRITPAGTYAIASPKVGDEEFVAWLNAETPRGGLQRFEFADDPVTLVAPRKMEILEAGRSLVVGGLLSGSPLKVGLGLTSRAYPSYHHAGVRNHYADVRTFVPNARERDEGDVAAVLEAVQALVRDWMESSVRSVGQLVEQHLADWTPDFLAQWTDGVADMGTEAAVERLPLSSASSLFCFHHPTWYLVAAYQQLSESERHLAPPRPPLPRPGCGTFECEACGEAEVRRGQDHRAS